MSGGRLAGKVAFISGTGLGIGRAAAHLFAAEGAQVFGCDRDGAAAEATVESVRAAGGDMASVQADVSGQAGAHAWIEAGIAHYGGIDVLYNNAGAVRFAPILEVSPEDWAYTMRNDLDTVMWATQAAWPHLVQRGGGAIVNTAGIAAVKGQPHFGQSAHTASKAAVAAITIQHAAEGAAHGIRVNAISPGPTDTNAFRVELMRVMGTTDASPDDEALTSVILDGHPALAQIGRAEDAALCALFLASDEARWISAATVPVDLGASVLERAPAWDEEQATA